MLNLNTIYNYLDRGDGTCKFFNEKTKLCSIYNSRPDICRVDSIYLQYFQESITKEEFYSLNMAYCLELQKEKFTRRER